MMNIQNDAVGRMFVQPVEQPVDSSWQISRSLLCYSVTHDNKSLKIQDGGGRHLGKSKNRHISAAV